MVSPAGSSITLHGFDADHLIENVLFRNCRRGEDPVDGPEDVVTNKFVKNLKFEKDE